MTDKDTGKQDIYGAEKGHETVTSKDDVEKALLDIMEGVSFPSDKANLIKHAKSRKAGQAFIKWLENLPRKKAYQNLEEFRQAFIKDYNNYGAVKDPHITPGPGDE